ncbi:hypothetical protein [Pseudomonas juntendi]|uniref:hypothetical protein n=1 Tax=Pseudomonas juntendi TaxID=2666183 RepID=UPI001F25D329|nr:hypothetical protein [Pseudomonas juntendi]
MEAAASCKLQAKAASKSCKQKLQAKAKAKAKAKANAKSKKQPTHDPLLLVACRLPLATCHLQLAAGRSDRISPFPFVRAVHGAVESL